MQEGCIGLLTAIEKYDPARNMKFLTFAGKLIRETIIDALRMQSTAKDNSESGGIDMSLDSPLSDDEHISLRDKVANVTILSPEQEYMIKELRSELRSAMRQLSKRERVLILYHYGFLDQTTGQEGQKVKHTLADTAHHFHLTESRAKAFLRCALTELKRNMPQYYISCGKQFSCPEVVKPVLRAMEWQSWLTQGRNYDKSRCGKIEPETKDEGFFISLLQLGRVWSSSASLPNIAPCLCRTGGFCYVQILSFSGVPPAKSTCAAPAKASCAAIVTSPFSPPPAAKGITH